MNDKLVNLYGSHIVGLYAAAEEMYKDEHLTKPALPLLLELQEDEDGNFPYETEAEVRMMVFGRENNNWNDEANRADTSVYTSLTYNFNLQTSDDILYEIRGKHTESHGKVLDKKDEIYGITDIYTSYCYHDTSVAKAPFTRRMKQFASDLQKRLGTTRMEYLWNNLYKIGRGGARHGKCCGQPPAYIKEMEMRYFDVLREELAILKPDIIIFMTGGTADNAIIERFDLPNKPFFCIDDSLPYLRRVDIPNVKYAARTIHPSTPGVTNATLEAYNQALIEDIVKHL